MSLLSDSFKKAVKEITKGKEEILDTGFEKNMNKIIEQAKSDIKEERNTIVIDSLVNRIPESNKENIVDIDEDLLLYRFNPESILKRMKEINKKLYSEIEEVSRQLVVEAKNKNLDISLFEMMKLVIEEIEIDRRQQSQNK